MLGGAADVHIGQCSVAQQVQSAAVTHHGIGSHGGDAGVVMHFQTGHVGILTNHERCESIGQAGCVEAGEAVVAQVQTSQPGTITLIEG